MKTRDVLAWIGVTVMALAAGKFIGKVEALEEVLNKDDISVDSLTVKLTKKVNLTVFKKVTEK